jgi:hypothetical protein
MTTLFSTLATDPHYLSLDLNLDYLKIYNEYCVKRGVGYTWGAKCPSNNLGKFPPTYTSIDCSGYMDAIFAYMTSGGLILPDGSLAQFNWFSTKSVNGLSFKECPYENSGIAGDTHLRINFLLQSECGDRHVWLTYLGKTIESHGGAGVDQRPWDSLILKDHCLHSFVVC